MTTTRDTLTPVADFTVENHGTILILNANSEAAREWVKAHITGDEVQTWGRNGTVVEPRYIEAILSGIADEELSYE